MTSPQLESSPSLCRFLRYVVDETLAGRGGMLKEYSLGAEVFARGDQFDPRLDPIVRVQARNLRARLAKYYEGPGAHDPIFIELPKRTYVPVFHAREQQQSPEPSEPPEPVASPEPILAEAASPETQQPPAPAQIEERPSPWKSLRAIVAGLLVLLACGAALWPTSVHGIKVATHRPDPAVQDLYIRGRFLMDRGTEQKLEASIDCFQQALARDPDFAAAYSGLADAYNMLAQFGYMPPAEGMEKARQAAQQAIAIAPQLAEGHVSLAAVLEAYDWNWTGAEREYRKALELNPTLAEAHLWYGMFLRDQGRSKEALPELRRAAELSPVSVMTSMNLAQGLISAGDLQAGLEQARLAVELAPDLTHAQVLLSNAAFRQGNNDEAERALVKAAAGAAGRPHELSMVASIYAHRGRKEEGATLFREMESLARQRYVSPFDLGRVSLSLGDQEGAVNFFEEAFRQRSSGMIFLRESKLSAHPRFQQLIQKMHFAS